MNKPFDMLISYGLYKNISALWKKVGNGYQHNQHYKGCIKCRFTNSFWSVSWKQYWTINWETAWFHAEVCYLLLIQNWWHICNNAHELFLDCLLMGETKILVFGKKIATTCTRWLANSHVIELTDAKYCNVKIENWPYLKKIQNVVMAESWRPPLPFFQPFEDLYNGQ